MKCELIKESDEFCNNFVQIIFINFIRINMIVYILSAKKSFDIWRSFGYHVDENIVCTYMSFAVFVEDGKYRIHFVFIHKTNNNDVLSEHVYERSATQNDFKFFVYLLYNTSKIEYEEI